MNRLEAVAARYDERRTAYARRAGEAEALGRQLASLQGQERDKLAEAEVMERVAALLESYSEAEHAELRSRVEALATFGLGAVFGEGLSVRLETGAERGQATMRFRIVSGGVEADPMEAAGGGLAQVVGFVLRLVDLMLRPEAARFLFLDETFAMVSEEYQEPMAALLRRLADEAGVQVVLVTHLPRLGAYADRAYRLSAAGGATRVQALEPGDV